MNAIRGFLTGFVGVFVGGVVLVTGWQFRPAGQVNVDLAPNDYAFLVSTTDNSLAGADFTSASLANSAVSGQTIFIPKVWQQVKPGWGPGTRTALPSGRLFIVPGVRQTITLNIELDTLDVVNVTVPFKVTVRIPSQDDAAKFITSVYGALEDAEQEGTEVRPNITQYILKGGGASRIKEATQRVYGVTPLSKMDEMKSGLLADAKTQVTAILAEVGLEVTEFGYNGDYVFNSTVTETLQARRDSLTELQGATKEVATAKQVSAAVRQRLAAFPGQPELALQNRCTELGIRYLDRVIAPAVAKGLFSDVRSAPESFPFGVPSVETVFKQFGCSNITE